jgi:hypothetical protein
MKFITFSAFTVAALFAVTSCTNIVHVHEYHSGKTTSHVDTVYVVVDPSETPEQPEGGSRSGTQPGSPEAGEYTDPWTTYYSLGPGGAMVETCTYQSGQTRHTILGNLVTGSGPHLMADARVWKEGATIDQTVLILEFEPPLSVSGGSPETSDDFSGSISDPATADMADDPQSWTEASFLLIRSAGQQYTFDLDDCSSIEIDSDDEKVSVEVILPVSLALLRDISHSCSVSFSIAYRGADSFTKYFTEINDGNMYQFYTLFVQGDGNPTLLPVER